MYGSVDDGVRNHTKKISVTAVDCEFGTLTGAGIWNCADEVVINATGCKISRGLGNQMAYYQKHDSNHTLEDSAKGVGSNQYVKKSVINAKDCKVFCLYAAGNNGFSTTIDATLNAEGCECDYLCNGQSNGTVANVSSVLKDCKIDILNQNNRGYWGNGSIVSKGGNEINKQYVFGDITDMPTALITGKVSLIDIDATDTIKEFYVGAIGNKEITSADEAAKYVDLIKISRSTNIIYANNTDVILKDIIRIK
jgi:hypothetical protein